MNSSIKSSSANGERKTKAQLQQELDAAEGQIQQLEDELAAKIGELDAARQNIGKLAQAREKLSEKDAMLARVQARIESLQKEAEEAEREKKTFEKKYQTRGNKLGSAEKRIGELKQHVLRLEKNKVELESKYAELGEKIAEEPAESEAAAAELPASKSTFRIELYPHEGYFQGRIEHVLSNDKRTFNWQQKGEILAFISSHLPQLEPAASPPDFQAAAGKAARMQAQQRPGAGVSALQAATMETQQPGALQTAAPGEVRASHDHAPRLIPAELRIVPGTSGIVQHNETFRVQIELEAGHMQQLGGGPVEYTAHLHAKPLKGRQRHVYVETEASPLAGSAIVVDVPPDTFTPGIYRIDAEIGFTSANGAPLPAEAFTEAGVIHVY